MSEIPEKKSPPDRGQIEKKVCFIWIPGLEWLIPRYHEYLMANAFPLNSLLDSSLFLK
jgi:hypothetical protein